MAAPALPFQSQPTEQTRHGHVVQPSDVRPVLVKQVQVLVPQACVPGQQLAFTTNEGEALTVTLQEHVQPGTYLTLQYHCAAPMVAQPHAPVAPPPAAIQPAEPVSNVAPLRANGREVQMSRQPRQTEEAVRRRRRQRKQADESARRCGQCLYLAGWLFLPFFGLGLLLWMVAACQYFIKTPKERKLFPQQSVTAYLSLASLSLVVMVVAALIAGFLILNPLEAFQVGAANHVESPSMTSAHKPAMRGMLGIMEKFKAWQQEHHNRWATIQVMKEDRTGSPLITATLSSKHFLGKKPQAATTLPAMVFNI